MDDTHIDIKLDRILVTVRSESAWDAFRNHGISDMWLPIPKPTLQKLILDSKERNKFIAAQSHILDTEVTLWSEQSSEPSTFLAHIAIEDDEELIIEHGILGEGGYSTVTEVSIMTSPTPIRCVRKSLGRPKQLKAQKQAMAAFTREINVMRQVVHQHCVEFIGSYTDLDHLNILSSPIADMDLAMLLDRPTTVESRQIIYRGIGCICDAMRYLHLNKIRHEDLKPQNVLIHNENILLTDFGFSLEFSEDSVSTTTGRPAAWTIRYSAPEVLDFEPRNRATDIFSLGCVLLEMVSGFYGQSLTTVREFWKRAGNGQSSFSRNPEAAMAWLTQLREYESDTLKVHMFCSYIPLMLQTNRLHRPTIHQVIDRLSDLSVLLPEAPAHVATKCLGDRPCTGLTNVPDRVGQVLTERLARLSYPAEYFHPWEHQSDWVWELWDMNMNRIPVASLFTSFDLISDNRDELKQACEIIYRRLSMKGSTRDSWDAYNQKQDVSFDTEGGLHAFLSAKMMSLKHVVFTRRFLRSKLETHPPGMTWNVQITFLPICLQRSPHYGLFFWMISYPLKGSTTHQHPTYPVGNLEDFTKVCLPSRHGSG